MPFRSSPEPHILLGTLLLVSFPPSACSQGSPLWLEQCFLEETPGSQLQALPLPRAAWQWLSGSVPAMCLLAAGSV